MPLNFTKQVGKASIPTLQVVNKQVSDSWFLPPHKKEKMSSIASHQAYSCQGCGVCMPLEDGHD